jgi:hypothetical protein
VSTALTVRFTELGVALAGAKDRLRAAVAEELGRAAGNALRDALAAGTRPSFTSRTSYTGRDPWDDDRRWDERDPWDEDRTGYRDRDEDEPDDPVRVRPAGVPPAIAVGLGLWRWWLCRSGSWRGAIALGVAAGVTTVLGGPVIRAVLATIAVAADLLSPAPLTLNTR